MGSRQPRQQSPPRTRAATERSSTSSVGGYPTYDTYTGGSRGPPPPRAYPAPERSSAERVIPISSQTYVQGRPVGSSSGSTFESSTYDRPRRSTYTDPEEGRYPPPSSAANSLRPTLQYDSRDGRATSPLGPPASRSNYSDRDVYPATSGGRGERRKVYHVDEKRNKTSAEQDYEVAGRRGVGHKNYHLTGSSQNPRDGGDDYNAYEYTDARGMYRDTEPARGYRARRGSVDAVSRDRPSSLVEHPARQSMQFNAPPPATRAIDRLDRHGSLRDGQRSPPRSRHRGSFGDDGGHGPRLSMPQPEGRQQYPESPAFMLSPTRDEFDRRDSRLDDRPRYRDNAVVSRGFGIRSGSVDNRGSRDHSLDSRPAGYLPPAPIVQPVGPTVSDFIPALAPERDDRPRRRDSMLDRDRGSALPPRDRDLPLPRDRDLPHPRDRDLPPRDRDVPPRDRDPIPRERDAPPREYERDLAPLSRDRSRTMDIYSPTEDRERDRPHHRNRDSLRINDEDEGYRPPRRHRESDVGYDPRDDDTLRPRDRRREYDERDDHSDDRSDHRSDHRRKESEKQGSSRSGQIAAAGLAGVAGVTAVEAARRRHRDRTDKEDDKAGSGSDRDRAARDQAPRDARPTARHPPRPSVEDDVGDEEDDDDVDKSSSAARSSRSYQPDEAEEARRIRKERLARAASPDEEEFKRERHYAKEPEVSHSKSAASESSSQPAIDPDEEYRRRLRAEADRLKLPPSVRNDQRGPSSETGSDRSRRDPQSEVNSAPPSTYQPLSMDQYSNAVHSPAPSSIAGGRESRSYEPNRYVPADTRPGRPATTDEDPHGNEGGRKIRDVPSSEEENIMEQPPSFDAEVVQRQNNRVSIVEPPRDGGGPRGILKRPTVHFPEDPNPIREGVAPLKDSTKKGIPPDAKWTKISRKIVNPEALEQAQERFEERQDFVIVLRPLDHHEIQKLADKTNFIRQERFKKQHPGGHPHEPSDQDRERTRDRDQDRDSDRRQSTSRRHHRDHDGADESRNDDDDMPNSEEADYDEARNSEHSR